MTFLLKDLGGVKDIRNLEMEFEANQGKILGELAYVTEYQPQRLLEQSYMETIINALPFSFSVDKDIRRNIFSTTTIESSTTLPMAIVIEPSV